MDEQLTLGGLIAKLEAIKDKEKHVWFDFEDAFPTRLESWRGIYEYLALGFSFPYQDKQEEPTVTVLLQRLKGAVGSTFEGYKGGTYRMSEKTPVWVANHGNVGNTALSGVLDGEAGVILETRYKEL